MTQDNRRSDAIRARRASRGSAERTPARKQSAPSTRSPRSPRKLAVSGREPYQAPVLMRSIHNTLPTQAQPRRTRGTLPREPRRRYDVALSVPGAEIRLPSIPQVEVGWRALSLVIVLFTGWLLYFMWTSPSFQVKSAQVSGLQRATAAEVNQILGLTGEPVFVLNRAELEEQVRGAFPEFSSVALEINFPNKVQLTVTERVPVIIWDNRGQANLIDTDGFAFPLRYELTSATDEIEGMPVVSASGMPPMPLPAVENITSPIIPLLGLRLPNVGSAPQLLPADMVVAVQTLAEHAPAEVELVYEARHGLGWQDERGWTVYFGDARSMEVKLRIYEALVARLAAEELQPALISVEHVHAPYYRLEH
jgi:hypothetical protein